MNVAAATLLVFASITFAQCDLDIKDEDYELLPPIFHIDPYEECLKTHKNYCRISIKLRASDRERPSKIWNIIEATKTSKRHYRHDELYYAICVNDYVQGSGDINTTTKAILSRYFTEKHAKIGVVADVLTLHCDSDRTNIFEKRSVDFLLLYVFVLYVSMQVIVTIMDCCGKDVDKRLNKYLLLFSMRRNYEKMVQNYRKSCREKLKCIQGFRFFTTVLIIFCHTFASYAGGYIQNTRYLEDIPLNLFRHSVRNTFVFLVSTFFLISGWLLSYKTFTIFGQQEKLSSCKFVLLTFINRYLRILPPIFCMILSGYSVWIYGNFHGPIKDIYSDTEYLRCQKTWWITLLFIGNHYQPHNMCYFISWYLSADTQLYAISLIILITIYKVKRKIISILGGVVVIGIIVPAFVTYLYDLDVIYRINPENSKNNMHLSFHFNASYASTYSNVAAYMLGLLFGYIYYKYDGDEFFQRKTTQILWWLLFLALPSIAIFISGYRLSGVFAAILSGLLKPTFALGMAVGILGMSQNIGGFVKRIFEWKPLLFLGHLTYSTYVVQFGIVFYRIVVAKKPMYISDYVLFSAVIQDVFYSFLCGFSMHILVEIPCSQLQNMCVPKIRHSPKKQN